MSPTLDHLANEMGKALEALQDAQVIANKSPSHISRIRADRAVIRCTKLYNAARRGYLEAQKRISTQNLRSAAE